MKNLYFILLATLLFSCSGGGSESGPDSVKNTDSALFREFLKVVPDTALPMKIYCGFTGGLDTLDRSRFRKFMPDNYSIIIGKIDWKSGKFFLLFFAVIGDLLYPYVYSYDYSGNFIDSIYLHNGNCFECEYEENVTFTEIEKDMTIIMTDTIRKYWFDENDTDYVRELDSLIITKTVKKMDNKGHFYLVSSKDSVVVEEKK